MVSKFMPGDIVVYDVYSNARYYCKAIIISTYVNNLGRYYTIKVLEKSNVIMDDNMDISESCNFYEKAKVVSRTKLGKLLYGE